MEGLCRLGEMCWRPLIFGWEVSCESSRRFGIGRFRFFQILRLRLLSLFYIFRLRLLSSLVTNLCIVALQLEYIKKQGTENLHFPAISKLGYIKKQDTKHLDSAIIFEELSRSFS
ncbi:hypothetical protein L3X38_007220 [Prunus dulcis]|uniref:Uncharacterized protein n=1 Tax=Prunus dulcis TaxID=3755 RepID=A0AAD4ZU41_PRUDU|nr:hypothetical protein L3X38_007220 [Prunus dulcis]